MLSSTRSTELDAGCAPARSPPMLPVEPPARVHVEEHEAVEKIWRQADAGGRALVRAHEIEPLRVLPLEPTLLAARRVLERGRDEDEPVQELGGIGRAMLPQRVPRGLPRFVRLEEAARVELGGALAQKSGHVLER